MIHPVRAERRGKERRGKERRGEERKEGRGDRPWNTEKNLSYMLLWLILLVALIVIGSIKAVVNGHSQEEAESAGSDLG